MENPTENRGEAELAQLLASEPGLAGPFPKEARGAAELARQMAGARWPAGLGIVLRRVRRSKGFSRREAVRELRRRLRKKIILQASCAALRGWENRAVAISPWLLVEYLQALEAPLEEWIRALIEFTIASGDSGYRRRVFEIVLHLEEASKRERKQLLPVFREWVELQAMLVGLTWRMQLVSGAIGELVPGVGEEAPEAFGDGFSGLGARVEALGDRLSGLLAQARAEASTGGETDAKGDGEA